jgi:hypothetical protein
MFSEKMIGKCIIEFINLYCRKKYNAVPLKERGYFGELIMKNSVKCLLILPTLMIAGSQVGVVVHGMNCPIIPANDEERAAFLQYLQEHPPAPDDQTTNNIKAMKDKIDSIVGECIPGDHLTDGQIDEIVNYTCGGDSEVVALRAQNNTHMSIPGQYLVNKGVPKEDVTKVEQKTMERIYADTTQN